MSYKTHPVYKKYNLLLGPEAGTQRASLCVVLVSRGMITPSQLEMEEETTNTVGGK